MYKLVDNSDPGIYSPQEECRPYSDECGTLIGQIFLGQCESHLDDVASTLWQKSYGMLESVRLFLMMYIHTLLNMFQKSFVAKEPAKLNMPQKQKRSSNILIGWLHKSKDDDAKYVQVKKLLDGGGTRRVHVIPEETLAVSLLETIKPIFYPDGLSSKGALCKMDAKLGNFHGEIIEDFEAGGRSCNLGEYLKVNCL